MNVIFIPAADLKRQYTVHGHFYSLEVPNTQPMNCRSVLEIRSKDISGAPEADAIFIMMNPGSSRPRDPISDDFECLNIADKSPELVPTVPDVTQYQVMRVMHYSAWQRVRVINLSDLREPNSDAFAKRYKHLEAEANIKSHSIFSQERSTELNAHLYRKAKAPIICAWGVSDTLKPLIVRAMAAIPPENTLVGLEKPGEPSKFFHPLPTLQAQKDKWVIDILKLLCP